MISDHGLRSRRALLATRRAIRRRDQTQICLARGTAAFRLYNGKHLITLFKSLASYNIITCIYLLHTFTNAHSHPPSPLQRDVADVADALSLFPFSKRSIFLYKKSTVARRTLICCTSRVFSEALLLFESPSTV